MAACTFPVWLVRQKFAGDTCLWEALLQPDCAVLASADHSPEALLRRLEMIIADQSEDELAQRAMVTTPRVEERTIVIDPPPHVAHWEHPIAIRFHVVVWPHPGGTWIGYVPALRQFILRASSADLLAGLEPEIRRDLERQRWHDRLDHLTRLALVENVTLESHTLTVARLSPLQRMKRDRDQEDARASVLRECVTAREPKNLPRALGRNLEAQRLARLLTGRFSRPVLLIGPHGVGKSTLLHEAVAGSTTLPGPFWETDGLRLVAGMSGFGMWQARCQKVATQARRAMALLHLGNLAELAQSGFSVSNEQGIGDWFAGAIPREGLLAVAECTPEQFTALERRFPRLVQVFERFDVDPPSDETLLKILARTVPARWADGALREVLRLHTRFATESAAPGRPLRFVRNLAEDITDRPVTETDVIAAFSRETGIPPALLDDTVALDPAKLRDELGAQVIGQPDAIAATVDVIVRLKARLQRPGKPLATLLFTGPTGVGKTELAKAIARFFFSDEQRMIRIDMSEYAHPARALRLFGGSAEQEGVLTARIRENPFALVLLDEFEKAHPVVFDLLLQVCGEGRLTDEAGRLADFRNAVIVLTSNLGAASFLKPSSGFAPTDSALGESTRAADHFVAEARRFLRPEMFNRLDAIVPFLPLSMETARQVVARQIQLLQQRQGLSERRLHLQFTEGAIDRLLHIGLDPRYGARPLKRALDQHVLIPLAEKLNARGAPANQTLAITADAASGFSGAAVDVPEDTRVLSTKPELALVTESRRRLGALFRNHTFRDLLVEHERLARRIEKLDRKVDHSPDAIRMRQQFTALATLVARAHELRRLAQQTEDALLSSTHDTATTVEEAATLNRSTHDLFRSLESRDDPAPDQATWLAFCDDNLHLRKILFPQLLAATSTLFRQPADLKLRVLKLRQRAIPDDPKFRALRRQPEPIACLQAGFIEVVEIEVAEAGRERALDEALDGDWSGFGLRIQAPYAWRLLRHAGAAFEVAFEDKRYRGLLAALRGYPALGGRALDGTALTWSQPTLPGWSFDRAAGVFRVGSARTRESGRELGARIAHELQTHYQQLLWSWIS